MNYPDGAKNDPRAPYNEPLTKEYVIAVDVTYTVLDNIKIKLDAYYNEDGEFIYNEDALKKAVLDVILAKTNVQSEDLGYFQIEDFRTE